MCCYCIIISFSVLIFLRNYCLQLNLLINHIQKHGCDVQVSVRNKGNVALGPETQFPVKQLYST